MLNVTVDKVEDRVPVTVIRLDGDFYKMIDDFEERFPNGAPSLRLCNRLTVEGDITFGSGVAIEGKASVRSESRACVPDGTVIRGTVDL